MIYNRGDVVLVLFPDSNLVTAKRRPALIIQADKLATSLPQRIVAMISSQLGSHWTPQSRVRFTFNIRGSADGAEDGFGDHGG